MPTTSEQSNTELDIREINKNLVSEFPFILPKNRYTGRVPDGYDYSYTALDWMPPGWKKKFGIKMCKDIKKSLIFQQIPPKARPHAALRRPPEMKTKS